jgi:hypothetical protein
VIDLFTTLAREHFHLDSGSDIVLAAINDPCNGRNDEDDAEGGDTVVCFSVSGKA